MIKLSWKEENSFVKTLHASFLPTYQCDQMVRLFFQYVAINNNENLFYFIRIGRSRLKMVPYIK